MQLCFIQMGTATYHRRHDAGLAADLADLRLPRPIDRLYAQPLDVPAMARTAPMSPAHFSREIPGRLPRYALQLPDDVPHGVGEVLLRQGMSVTDTCFAVGCTSPDRSARGSPRSSGDAFPVPVTGHSHIEAIPSCVSMVATRPRRTPISGRASAAPPAPAWRRRRSEPSRTEQDRRSISRIAPYTRRMDSTVASMSISVHDPEAALASTVDASAWRSRTDV